MIRINLLPVKEVQRKEMLVGQVVVLVIAVSVVLLSSLGGYMFFQGQIDEEERLIAEKNAEINRLKKVLGEVRQFEKKQKELRGKLDVLAKLKENKSGPVHLLDELSSALSEGVWVESFVEKGGSVSISAIGLTQKSAAEFMRNLESSSYFKNVELKVITQKKVKDIILHKFQLRCEVERPAKKK